MLQDFSGQNLRGRSFKGQNLAGANFNGADIRGTDFSWANLTDANLTNVHAGVSQKWIISVGLLLLFLIFSALSTYLIVPVLVNIFIIIFLTIGTSKYNYTTNGQILTVTSVLAILGSVALVLAVVLYLVITQIASVSVVIAGLPPVVVGIVGLVYVVLVGSESGILSTANNDVGGFISLSKAIINELIKNTITNTGGTSFHAANLINADFQNASLKYTNFGKANVTCNLYKMVSSKKP